MKDVNKREMGRGIFFKIKLKENNYGCLHILLNISMRIKNKRLKRFCFLAKKNFTQLWWALFLECVEVDFVSGFIEI